MLRKIQINILKLVKMIALFLKAVISSESMSMNHVVFLISLDESAIFIF